MTASAHRAPRFHGDLVRCLESRGAHLLVPRGDHDHAVSAGVTNRHCANYIAHLLEADAPSR